MLASQFLCCTFWNLLKLTLFAECLLYLVGLLAPWDQPYHGHGDGGSIWQINPFSHQENRAVTPCQAGHGVDDLSHSVDDLGHKGLVTNHLAILTGPVPTISTTADFAAICDPESRVGHGWNDLSVGNHVPGLTAIELLRGCYGYGLHHVPVLAPRLLNYLKLSRIRRAYCVYTSTTGDVMNHWFKIGYCTYFHTGWSCCWDGRLHNVQLQQN